MGEENNGVQPPPSPPRPHGKELQKKHKLTREYTQSLCDRIQSQMVDVCSSYIFNITFNVARCGSFECHVIQFHIFIAMYIFVCEYNANNNVIHFTAARCHFSPAAHMLCLLFAAPQIVNRP